jgi:hypothetical protein
MDNSPQESKQHERKSGLAALFAKQQLHRDCAAAKLREAYFGS